MTLRTLKQMDEKDWIIVRLYSLLLRINGPGVVGIPEINRTTSWLANNLWLMTFEAGITPNDPYAQIVKEQIDQLNQPNMPPFPTIAAWPYTKLDEPTPDECLVVTQMENA